MVVVFLIFRGHDGYSYCDVGDLVGSMLVILLRWVTFNNKKYLLLFVIGFVVLKTKASLCSIHSIICRKVR